MQRRGPSVVLLVLLLAVAFVVCARLGVVRLTWRELWHSDIFWNLRCPRLVLSALVGGALSVCGAAYQSVFRNPLTDPYVLGISSGASLGAAVAIVAGLQAYAWGVGGMALATGLLTMWLIYRVATLRRQLHTTTLLLTGVCITFLMNAVVSFLMVMHQDKMDSVIFWTMGSFASASWRDVLMVLPVVAVGTAVALSQGKNLNLLLTGGETARSLGVDVDRVRRRLLFFTTLMVAFSVSVSGVVGFVGLTVPHCVRLVAGADNRRVLPYSFLLGALFLLLCDTLARVLLQPSELPVGSLTALVGAPLFVYLLYTQQRRRT